MPSEIALFFDIDIKHLGFLTVIAFSYRPLNLFRQFGPIEVGEMDHAVDVTIEADERPNSVFFLTSPSTSEFGRIIFSAKASQRIDRAFASGQGEMRRLTGSTSST